MPLVYKEKKVLILISSSAGELDWILPIVQNLYNKCYKITVIYLSRRAKNSVKENTLLQEFVNQPSVDEIYCGGKYFEFIDKYGYLLNRLKLKLNLPNILNSIYSLSDKLMGAAYIYIIRKNCELSCNDKYLIFSEFPNLRRARDMWVKNRFTNSTYLYHPHSTNINQDLDNYSNKSEIFSYKGNEFLLLAHPGEYKELRSTGDFNFKELGVVYLGNPKYSKDWLAQYKNYISNKNNKSKNVRILVISRGYGSYINKNQYINLIDSVIKSANIVFDDYTLIVKKHPRETKSYWNEVSKNNSSIQITENHIMKDACTVDFAISFWTSAALDCHLLGLPVIEFFDPNTARKSVTVGESKDTVLRKIGVAASANNESELVKAINKIKKNNYLPFSTYKHPYVDDMLKYSNDWKCEFNKIISVNGFN